LIDEEDMLCNRERIDKEIWQRFCVCIVAESNKEKKCYVDVLSESEYEFYI